MLERLLLVAWRRGSCQAGRWCNSSCASISTQPPDLPLALLAQVTAVISAHNDHSKPYNLTAVVASLNSPMDFEMYIQNFTHQVRAPRGRRDGSGTVGGALQQHSSSSGRRRLRVFSCPSLAAGCL